MNVKMNLLLGVSSLVLLGAFISPQSISAFESRGEGKSDRFGGGDDRYRLVSEEIREEFRAKRGNLSEEDRVARREEKMAFRQEKGTAIQEFTGLTREEMREACQNGESIGDILAEKGLTQQDAEAFLTEQANNRLDGIVERHNLDESAEQTLKERVAKFVQSILSRWFSAE
jgi:DNA-directed RNA polymerase specialized sigma subunit